MNLVVERAPALSALSRVVGVVERKQTIAILGNVALSASEGTLRMRATDLEMEAIETVAADVADFGDITVPADKLHDIVRNADTGAQVSVEMNAEATRVLVKSGRSRFNLPALSIDAFPVFPADALDGGFTMPAKLLADMLARVVWAVAPPPNQSALACVYLATVGDELHAVGCSSSGIGLRREPKPEGAEIAAIMPIKFVSHVTKWLSTVDGDARIACSGNLIRVEHGGSILTSKLDGAPGYARYLEALIEAQDVMAKTDQDGVSLALRRVMVMAEGKTNSVQLSFAPGTVGFQARSNVSGEGADELASDYDGEPIAFLLSAGQLSSTLASLHGDIVEIGFSQHPSEQDHKTQKVIVRAPSDPGYTSIIMQCRA